MSGHAIIVPFFLTMFGLAFWKIIDIIIFIIRMIGGLFGYNT